MKIVIAGGSGFIGEPLVRRLTARDHDVAVLSRDPAKVKAGRGLQWDARTLGPWAGEAAAADAIINLTGENVGEGRWTEARKKRLVDSRINSTNVLIEAMRREPTRPRTFINATATGIYGNRGEETLDETSSPGSGFLADLVVKWESAARNAEPIARLVLPRFGVVLAPDGGALAKLLLPFKLGAGGRIGNGRQWMPWIDRDDALRFIEWALESQPVRGVYNATSPHPARNSDFASSLGRALRRPALLPTPALALRLAFGEMADETILVSQRVVPARAQQEGFVFEYPTLDASLAHQLRR